MNNAARRRVKKIKWEQNRRRRLARRASNVCVTIETWGTSGRSWRRHGVGPAARRSRKAGGPKRVIHRPHR